MLPLSESVSAEQIYESASTNERTSRSDKLFPIEYEMALEPFQVLLDYDDSFPMAKSEEMIVLSSTQNFLSTQLDKSEPDFVRLMLYQYVRDYVMDTKEHYSKIAMNGMVFFSSPITDELRSRVVNQIFKNMSADSQVYVNILRSNGMDHVVNATLLSMQGNEMMYQDGEMIEMNSDSESIDSTEAPTTVSRDMGNDMRNTVLLLCLLIPVGVLLVAATVFILRFVREVNWRRPSNDENLWQIQRVTKKKRKKSSNSSKDSDTGHSSQGHDPLADDLSDLSFDTSTEV